MSEHTQGNRDLLYGLHNRPAPAKAFLGATQHVLASFVGIITPSLIIVVITDIIVLITDIMIVITDIMIVIKFH